MTHSIALLAAAFVAGIINSVAGGGTLLTFPVLIWVGLNPKTANATSTVALWPGLIGGMWGYRRELHNSKQLLVRLGITSVCGGAVGAWLLIRTPTPLFARLVPFLILFATVLFIVQEPVSRWLRTQMTPGQTLGGWWVGAIIFQFLSAIYGGYFGAGNGILMLAVLGLIGLNDIHKANGVKNYLGICLNSAAIIGFAFSGLVDWPDALLMAVSAIAGGYFGASIAQRLGRVFVRRAVIVIGLVIGVVMLIRIER
ncbi:MAG: sulfite exporter TauE/SafE family protein [Pyrinomonadaceae bacterium]